MMRSSFKKTISVKTPKHVLRVDCYSRILKKGSVKINKAELAGLCRSGCRNYNEKYSCPPFAPDFHEHTRRSDRLLVVLLKMDLDQFAKSGYREDHKLRLANAVIKPLIERVMRRLEESPELKGRAGEYLSTGACRLCRPCKRKLREPCKHPEKMRFSLEALGVDCSDIASRLFGLSLLWYKDKKAPEYTLVMCALPISPGLEESEVLKTFERTVNQF
ncbi:hypothetical protein JW826_00840 [Candidatus Woesearchaeota archaeon]|nr:hypothetical protein [Candidatus Woesearchaeota archaeon]